MALFWQLAPRPRCSKSWKNILHSRGLRCPETIFISHENTNFIFSVFRMVEGEAKTSKIMGCCKATFAFLPALKIGTFRKKWTWEWVFKTSLFVHLALYYYFFFLSRVNLLFLCMFLNDAKRELQKNVDLEWRTVQKVTFCLYVWKPVSPEIFSFSVLFSIITHERLHKICFSTSS